MSYFNLTLDTIPPQSASLVINGGAAVIGQTAVTAAIACSDASTGGYTMKIYGDIYDSVKKNSSALTEADVSWETYATSKNLTLLGTSGKKTVRLKIRDDVHNTTAEITASITLDTIVPTVTITGPDVAKISEQATKNTSSFSFVSDKAFTSYKVMLVQSISAVHNTPSNVQIPDDGGSVGMTDSGTFEANTSIDCSISGTDLKAATGGSDGAYIIKVFVFDGVHWSVA